MTVTKSETHPVGWWCSLGGTIRNQAELFACQPLFSKKTSLKSDTCSHCQEINPPIKVILLSRHLVTRYFPARFRTVNFAFNVAECRSLDTRRWKQPTKDHRADTPLIKMSLSWCNVCILHLKRVSFFSSQTLSKWPIYWHQMLSNCQTNQRARLGV